MEKPIRVSFVFILAFTVLVSCFLVPVSNAWSIDGHQIVTKLAIELLPEPWKHFFGYYGWLLNETSVYPDIYYRDSDPNEPPRHFIDLEIWNPNIPSTGTLPQSVVEFSEKMVIAIRSKNWNDMFLLAGRVSHYMADAAQPYHTTINYDPKSRNGVALHAVLDSSIAAHFSELKILNPTSTLELQPIRNITKFVLETAIQSHSFLSTINRTLIDENLVWSPELTKIIENRTNTAIAAVARVWYTVIVEANTQPPNVPQPNGLLVKLQNQSWDQNVNTIRVQIVDELGVKSYAIVTLTSGNLTVRAIPANVVPPVGEYVIIWQPQGSFTAFSLTAEREGYVGYSLRLSVTNQVSSNPRTSVNPVTLVAIVVMCTAFILIVLNRRRI
jgi:hypothetical protein